MSEHTIIKPRPGARQALPRSDVATPADDKTAFAPSKQGAPREQFRLPSTQLGIVCDEASKLLSLADRLGETKAVDDIASLKRQSMDLVREYQQALRTHDLSPETIEKASYCVCALH